MNQNSNEKQHRLQSIACKIVNQYMLSLTHFRYLPVYPDIKKPNKTITALNNGRTLKIKDALGRYLAFFQLSLMPIIVKIGNDIKPKKTKYGPISYILEGEPNIIALKGITGTDKTAKMPNDAVAMINHMRK